MDSKSRPPVHAEIFSDIVRNSFGTNEDEDFGVLSADLIQVFDQLRPLLKLTANGDDLLNVVIGCELHGPDVTLNEILQEVL